MTRAVRYPNAVSGSFEFARDTEMGEVVNFIEGVNKRAHELGAVPVIGACAVSPQEANLDYELGTQVLVAFMTSDEVSATVLGDALENVAAESEACEGFNFGVAPIVLIT